MQQHENCFQTNIVFLGTGAADWPEIIPIEENYRSNRKWRRLSSILINNHILVDCGPTTLNSMLTFGMDPQKVTDILITHTHEDHLSQDTLGTLINLKQNNLSLRLWAHTNAMGRIPERNGLTLHPLEVGKTFNIDDIIVKPLAANHVVDETSEKPLHFLFKHEDKQWLYAADGAWFLKSTWLELCKEKLDAIILDATIGEIVGDRRIFDHNSLPMIRIMLDTFKKQGVLNQNSYILLTHMARTLHPSHEEIELNLCKEGIIPAYDGLCIRL